jgi:DNA-binding SARP family transcriptional activator
MQGVADVPGPGKQDMMERLDRRRASRSRRIVRPSAQVNLSLLGSFELTSGGDSVSLPVPAQRLLAFIALRDRPVLRTHVAEMLWLDSTQRRACGSLRSALWRLRRPGLELVHVTSGRLRLEPRVVVDVRVLVAWARRVLDAPDGVDREPADLSRFRDPIFGELLPDWYDDWLVVERERLRELRVRALERVCERLTALRSFGPAIEAGRAAVYAAPLRESSHRCLIGAYLAEGNQAEALHEYRAYRDLLHDELALEPSSRMEELIGGLDNARVTGSAERSRDPESHRHARHALLNQRRPRG